MKLKNINLSVDEIQDIIVNSDIGVGDGKSIANIPEIPIKHLFADQIYIRQMENEARTNSCWCYP
jgi:hypothetical protein